MSGVGRYDIIVTAGDNWEGRFRWTTLNVAGEQVVVPLTGRTYEAVCQPSDGELIYFEVDVSEQDQGYLTLRLAGSQTRSVGRRGKWDLQETVDGKVTTVLRGMVKVDLDVTP